MYDHVMQCKNNWFGSSLLQINLMRMLKGANNATISKNYRPVQPLGDRKVNASFEAPTTQPPTNGTTGKPAITADASAINMTAGLFLLMLFAAFFMR